MPKINYDGSEDPTPCEVCGIDTLDGSRYCGPSCKQYAEDYREDIYWLGVANGWGNQETKNLG